jgi:aminoglycoside phosphotransferase family enzyme
MKFIAYCLQEVTLNRRLASSLYLGVVRIAEDQWKVSIDQDGRGLVSVRVQFA